MIAITHRFVFIDHGSFDHLTNSEMECFLPRMKLALKLETSAMGVSIAVLATALSLSNILRKLKDSDPSVYEKYSFFFIVYTK